MTLLRSDSHTSQVTLNYSSATFLENPYYFNLERHECHYQITFSLLFSSISIGIGFGTGAGGTGTGGRARFALRC